MWYEILVENKFAEFFIEREENFEDSEDIVSQMLTEYGELVSGVTMAWLLWETGNKETKDMLKGLSPNCALGFESCYNKLPLTETKMISDIWRSIHSQFKEVYYEIDIKLLSAEQCAVLIMYPFWSRMGGSFEKDFQKSGNLKKYLCALKAKCAKK